MFIADAHLDLAYNGLNGRDVLQPAAQQPVNEDGVATVGLPDLRAGNVSLVCATIFCEPAAWNAQGKGYTTPAEAHAIALQQYDWYRERSHAFRLIRTPADLPSPQSQVADENSEIPTLLLMEGADPLRTPDDVPEWFDRGLRIVGLAWKRTRHAGGTGTPGPLTAEGVELVKALDRSGLVHDASHLAEESFWQLLKTSDGPVIASHSNCRALVPTDRQLSDEMIRALVARGGVVGINYYDKFLLPPAEYGKRRATLADVVRHVRHVCDLAGGAAHVAVGTDMDGGFGREQIPEEIRTSADLGKLAPALAAAGFADADVKNILGENWLRFFKERLPA